MALALASSARAELASGPDVRAGLVDAGDTHSCAIVPAGVRCWGNGRDGRLGYGGISSVGATPGTPPAGAGPVWLPGREPRAVSAGGAHTCTLLDTGRVRCWGANWAGQLGYGHKEAIGDDELPLAERPVRLGGHVVAVSAGTAHTCAILWRGLEVRCWGRNALGELGYGHTKTIGDNEHPVAAEAIEFGPPDYKGYGSNVASEIAAGGTSTCVVTSIAAQVHCWGNNTFGQLGLGANAPPLDNLGDDERAKVAGAARLGEHRPVSIAAGRDHYCSVSRAALGYPSSGEVFCWGLGSSGQLGHGSSANIGDDETPAAAGPVDLGGPAVSIAAGDRHTCALLQDGSVRCWGANSFGQLGYGESFLPPPGNYGDDAREVPSALPPVDLGSGRRAVTLTAGGSSTCATLDDGTVRCWGQGTHGQLGQGDTSHYGDDSGEVPGALPAIELGGAVPTEVADLSIRQMPFDASREPLLRVGRTIDLMFDLYNLGPGTAGPVRIDTTMDRRLALLAVEPVEGRFVETRDTGGRWTLGNVAPSETGQATLRLRVRARRAGRLPVRLGVVDDGPGVVPKWTWTPHVLATRGVVVNARRTVPRLSLSLDRRRGIRLPTRFVAKGRLHLPRGLPSRASCRGKVAIRLRRSGRTLLVRRAALNLTRGGRCAYRRVFVVKRGARVGRRGKTVRVTAAFMGNRLLASRRARPGRVRVR